MQILFSLLTPQGKVHDYSMFIDELDLCFDVLNLAVSMGDILLWAKVIDHQDGFIALPPQAFDGHSIRSEMQALKADWDQILS